MSIPTQMSMTGFVASDPQLTRTRDNVARCYMRVGVEHARKETDGTFTPLEPSYHDLVIYGASAERANSRFHKGDSFVASGYTHEYEVERDGEYVPREEFVARRIGHDLARTRYAVDRSPTHQGPARQAEINGPRSSAQPASQAIGL
ncbi:MAG: single-stranded DNA-binding protein [Nocardioides sp.]|uniref:single-stranded DNA-binding protein n=1 Tax=Nocardioides sp. TaxID=35761 RepID=UPI0039E2DBDC